MHGNVREWCLDWLGRYRGGEVTNPRGPASGSLRIDRGGSWINRATDVRSALRNQSERDNRNDGVGFRLALVRNSSSTTPSVPPTVTAP